MLTGGDRLGRKRVSALWKGVQQERFPMSETHGNRMLQREDDGDVTIVRVLVDNLAITDVTRDVFNQVYALVDDMNRSKIILNFASVDYASSLALGKMVMLNRKIEAAAGRLIFCEINELITEVLAVSRLNQLFQICKTEDDARDAMRQPPPATDEDAE